MILLILSSTTACNQRKKRSTQTTTEKATTTLTVSAAASLQNTLQDIQSAYTKQHPHTTVIYNFGSSGSLMQQISQGAPVDVFLSASTDWMDALSQNGDIVETSRRPLLKNALVLIVSSETTDITSFQDLRISPSMKIAVGEPNSVPVGRYTQEVLSDLELFNVLKPQLVFGKDARQVLAYVETGNAAAGIVYVTDALASKQVNIIEAAAADTHSPITYPVAVIQGSQQQEAAQTFVNFLSTQAAQDIFERDGFEVIPSPIE